MKHEVSLPTVDSKGAVTLEAAISHRRSVREYAGASLSLDAVAQLLWAAQGMIGHGKRRAAPSAGALYPLEIYLFAGRVDGLAAGVYRYVSVTHRLIPVVNGDSRLSLSRASLEQAWVAEAPVSIILTSLKNRTARKYGRRAQRYVVLEAGCAAQNVSLQAVTLGLGSVHVGAFDDIAVSSLIGASEDEEEPLLLIAVGHPRSADDRLDSGARTNRRR